MCCRASRPLHIVERGRWLEFCGPHCCGGCWPPSGASSGRQAPDPARRCSSEGKSRGGGEFAQDTAMLGSTLVSSAAQRFRW